jgi:hypothetical protein
VCFFAISGVLPHDEAIEAIKASIEKTYAKKGEEIIAMNLQAVDNTLDNLFEVAVPETVSSDVAMAAAVPENAPPFVRDVLGAGNPGMGSRHLYPVRQMRAGLPARRYPHQSLRPGCAHGCPGCIQINACA